MSEWCSSGTSTVQRNRPRQFYTNSRSIVACISTPNRSECTPETTESDIPYRTEWNIDCSSCSSSLSNRKTIPNTKMWHWYLCLNIDYRGQYWVLFIALPLADLPLYSVLIWGIFCIKQKPIVTMLSMSDIMISIPRPIKSIILVVHFW